MALDNLINQDLASDIAGPSSSAMAAAASVHADSTLTSSSQPMEIHSRRLKLVSRRELLRKAEILVTKSFDMSSTIPIRSSSAKGASTLPTPSNGHVQVVVPYKFHDIHHLLGSAAAAAESSVPGSVHDSADDESELSELDDVAMKSMFSGLVKTENNHSEDLRAFGNEVIAQAG